MRAVYNKADSGTTKIEFSNKKETKVEVGYILKGNLGGSMGFYPG